MKALNKTELETLKAMYTELKSRAQTIFDESSVSLRVERKVIDDYEVYSDYLSEWSREDLYDLSYDKGILEEVVIKEIAVVGNEEVTAMLSFGASVEGLFNDYRLATVPLIKLQGSLYSVLLSKNLEILVEKLNMEIVHETTKHAKEEKLIVFSVLENGLLGVSANVNGVKENYELDLNKFCSTYQDLFHDLYEKTGLLTYDEWSIIYLADLIYDVRYGLI